MPYLILAFDKDGMEDVREGVRNQHRKYLKSFGDRLLASGAILADNKKIIGGLSLFDTENKKEAEKFERNDPYAKVGIRKVTQVIYWRKRWWNGKFLLDVEID